VTITTTHRVKFMHSAIMRLFPHLKSHRLRCEDGLLSLYSPKITHCCLCTLSLSPDANIARRRCTLTGNFPYVCLSKCLRTFISIRPPHASPIIQKNLIRHGTMNRTVYNVVMIKFTRAISCINVQVSPCNMFL
jgi:hypothetical protein